MVLLSRTLKGYFREGWEVGGESVLHLQVIKAFSIWLKILNKLIMSSSRVYNMFLLCQFIMFCSDRCQMRLKIWLKCSYEIVEAEMWYVNHIRNLWFWLCTSYWIQSFDSWVTSIKVFSQEQRKRMVWMSLIKNLMKELKFFWWSVLWFK